MARAFKAVLPRKLRSPQAGFTLIEVLVALAVVALALGAGNQAASALLRHSERQSLSLLAQVCADNELIKVRLSGQMPGLGESTFTCAQAERELGGTLAVFATPNPNFRRVEARMRESTESEAWPVLTVVSLVGRI